MNRAPTASLFVLFLSLSLAGCGVSLHSTQYNFVKGLVTPKATSPRPNWRVTWQQQEFPVYAINLASGTLFANEEGVAVLFVGWQVVELTVPGIGVQKIASISVEGAINTDRTLTYKNKKGIVLGIHECDAWRRANENNDSNSDVAWVQTCAVDNGQYKNFVHVNNRGQWVKLRFLAMPDEESLVIELIGSDVLKSAAA